MASVIPLYMRFAGVAARVEVHMPLQVKLPCGDVLEADNGSPIVTTVEACEECAQILRERLRKDEEHQYAN